MQRKRMTKRINWKDRCEAVGFYYYEMDNYWQEDRCYVFTAEEIDAIEAATEELHGMCINLVADIVKRGDYSTYNFEPEVCQLVERSWKSRQLSLCGRFDLAYGDQNNIKLLEYNADTPTALLEAAVVQWNWLEDMRLPDQFNSLHEKLIERWKLLKEEFPMSARVYFTALKNESPEDECHINYLMDTAIQAGLEVSSISVEEIGWNGRQFVDVNEQVISVLFKCYPWEFLMWDEFGVNVDLSMATFVEPAWKMLLSNKILLTLLWSQYPSHYLLLPSFIEKPGSGKWVTKPVLAREGENVIWQEYFEIPKFDGYTPVIGSWIVGDSASGIGIREDLNIITNNKSHFIPHYFTK